MKKMILFTSFFIVTMIFNRTVFANSLPSPLDSEYHNSTFSISVEPIVGYYKGFVNEYVFDDDYKLSELNWEMDKIFIGGMKLHASFFRHGFVCLNLSQSVNNDAGDIEDSDWDSEDGEKSHYSKHTLLLNKGLFFDFSSGYYYKFDFGLNFNIYLGYSFISLKMQAMDGYLEYPPGSTRQETYGLVMQYEQDYRISYVGMASGYVFNSVFSASVFFNSALMATCSTIDRHVLRDIDFYDKMENISWIEPGFSLDYKIAKNLILRFAFSSMRIATSKGDDYYIQTDSGIKSTVYEDAAGIKMSIYKIETSLNIKVF